MNTKRLVAVAASSLAMFANAYAGTITSQLVVHLKFDNDYLDSSGTGLDGTPVGSPLFDVGRIGPGAVSVTTHRDGSAFNYVTLGAPAQLNFGGTAAADASDFTVAMWVKFSQWRADPSFISNKDWRNGGNIGYVVATDGSGPLQWNFNDGNGRRDYDGAAGAIGNGNWHHIAVSFTRAGNAVTYIDGVLVDSRPISPVGPSLDAGLATNIGQDGTGTYTDGGTVGITNCLIDDVGIWRRALTSLDVARIYQFGTNGVSLADVPDPAGPQVLLLTPLSNATDVPVTTAIGAEIQDGLVALVPNSVQLSLNGSVVAHSLTKNGDLSTITFQPPSPLLNKSTNQVRLIFGDGINLYTNNWQFVTVSAEQRPSISGQWDFDRGDLSATIGQALEYLDGPAGTTHAQTQFGSTTSFGIADVNGVPAKVMRIPPAVTRQLGYIMRHGATPNGGVGNLVLRWTLILDMLIPNTGGETWFPYIQTDDIANNANDGDLFARFSGGTAGIGIGGSYQGAVMAGQWHRVAFAIDLTGDGTAGTPVISKFVDGAKAADQTRAPGETRHGLRPYALLFADEDGESQVAYVNSIQIRNYKMKDGEIAALGAPSANGIPPVSGQWDFNNDTSPAVLAATIGSDLVSRVDSAFSSPEPDDIGGEIANVMHFIPDAAAGQANGYVMTHGALPNAGGTRVNQYSLIMDIKYPAASTGFRSLWQVETNNPTTSDGDLFVNGGNGIGISSQYHGNVTPDVWHRVVFTFDLTKRELGKYVDGSNVLSGPVGSTPLGTGPYQYLSASSGIVDGRWSLTDMAVLFADEDGELGEGYVNSIQFRVGVLTPSEVAMLGRPTAVGIPVTIPPLPVILFQKDPGGLLLLSWPASYSSFILESSPALGPSADWTSAPEQIDNAATIDPTAGNRFFRLVR